MRTAPIWGHHPAGLISVSDHEDQDQRGSPIDCRQQPVRHGDTDDRRVVIILIEHEPPHPNAVREEQFRLRRIPHLGGVGLSRSGGRRADGNLLELSPPEAVAPASNGSSIGAMGGDRVRREPAPSSQFWRHDKAKSG